VQSSWAADSIEPQPESIATMVAKRRIGSFLKFIPQVYWILGARLRESIDLSHLGKLSNNKQ
jgi:hypothetical protein